MRAEFRKQVESIDVRFTTFNKLETLQVNLGDLCNLRCSHCHHNASPLGTRIMGRGVMDRIVAFLSRHPALTLDITGGCPEMNPDFRYFIEATSGIAGRRIIRSNLTIALEPGMEWLPDYYRMHGLIVTASLPCYELENVEKQRGGGVFNRSIEVLKQLNRQGYGNNLELHLVHNPGNGSVSGSRDMLEIHYRKELYQHFGINFSRLHCMNNTPLGRFKDQLERKGTYRSYIDHLAEKFNPLATEIIMCRSLISVGWDGVLYNCDFNLAAGLPLTRKDVALVTIDQIDEVIKPGCDILMAEHCFSCTAGQGSGCGGVWTGNSDKAHSVTEMHNPVVSTCLKQ